MTAVRSKDFNTRGQGAVRPSAKAVEGARLTAVQLILNCGSRIFSKN